MTSNSTSRTLWACLLAVPWCVQAEGAPTTGQLSQPMGAQWQVSGRAQLDHGRVGGAYVEDGRWHAASYLRRADIEARVRWHPAWRASLEVEADSELKLGVSSVFVSYRAAPTLEIRFGRIDPDFGLEQATSSSWTAGIERSAIWDLVPDVADALEGIGVRVDAHGRQWQSSIGWYDKRNHQAAVWRGVWWTVPQAGSLIQLGTSTAISRHWRDDGRLRSRLALRAVTETDAGQRTTLAEASESDYTGDNAVAVEAAVQHGPWMLQAEAVHRRLQGGTGRPDRIAQGATLQASWVMTGQARTHDAQRARFGKPAGPLPSQGAWESFYRIDLLRVRGEGEAAVHTLGLSWTADEHWRVQLNLHRARARDAGASNSTPGSGLAGRVQFSF